MTAGVLFYNWGLSCVPRLFVALSTFRRHNPGVPAYLMVPDIDESSHLYAEDVEALGFPLRTFKVPKGVTPKFLQPRAKMWVLEQSPFDLSVVYENDFMFQGSVAPLLETKADFGMTPCRNLRWSSPWMEGVLAAPGWTGFPDKNVLLDPSSLVYNPGMLVARKGAWFLQQWEETYRRYEPWMPTATGIPVGEETIVNIIANLSEGRSRLGKDWVQVPEGFNQDTRRVPVGRLQAATALHYVSRTHIGARHGTPEIAQVWWWEQFQGVLKAAPRCLEGLRTWDPVVAGVL